MDIVRSTLIVITESTIQTRPPLGSQIAPPTHLPTSFVFDASLGARVMSERLPWMIAMNRRGFRVGLNEFRPPTDRESRSLRQIIRNQFSCFLTSPPNPDRCSANPNSGLCERRNPSAKMSTMLRLTQGDKQNDSLPASHAKSAGVISIESPRVRDRAWLCQRLSGRWFHQKVSL
jgi:hypothetical protein